MENTAIELIEETLMRLTTDKESMSALLEKAKYIERLKLEVAYDTGFIEGNSSAKYGIDPDYKNGKDYVDSNFKK